MGEEKGKDKPWGNKYGRCCSGGLSPILWKEKGWMVSVVASWGDVKRERERRGMEKKVEEEGEEEVEKQMLYKRKKKKKTEEKKIK